MQAIEGINVRFIAGFGPIVRDASQSRKLYGNTLGIALKEEGGGYLHTEARGRKDVCIVAALSCRAVLFWYG